jgi:hypothetical protein
MKTNNAYIITENSISIILDSVPYVVSKADTIFARVTAAVTSGRWAEVEKLINRPKAIEDYMSGYVRVRNGVLTYKGRGIHGTIAKRIVGFMNEGHDHRPLVNFLKKLMANPSPYCRQQLYDYCENYKLPITPKGNFYAFKAVDKDLKDKYTGKISYRIGRTVFKTRATCNTDAQVGCAESLHCGNFDYVQQYGNGDTDRFILVEVSPRDVMACPIDCNWKKLRVCRMKVLKEIKREQVKEFKSEYALNNNF